MTSTIRPSWNGFDKVKYLMILYVRRGRAEGSSSQCSTTDTHFVPAETLIRTSGIVPSIALNLLFWILLA